MAFVQLPGICPLPDQPLSLNYGNDSAMINGTSAVIDATGEKIAFIGRVHLESRGSKDIRKIWLRFGTVVKAGGSACTLSLQNVNLATGPPIQPDETQDQTVAIPNASIASNTLLQTGALSADRTVTNGELLAVVLEFDGSGRLGADSIAWSYIRGSGSSPSKQQGVILKTASWASISAALPSVLLEMSDGSFGSLDIGLPFSAITTVGFNTGTTPDEYAIRIYEAAPRKVDGGFFVVFNDTAADFEIVLYDGTTAMTNGTVSVDSDATRDEGTYGVFEFDFPAELELSASHAYYLAVKPTTATSVTVPVLDVNTNAHFQAHPGGIEYYAAHRVDAGAWTLVNTRRPFAGLRTSSRHDGSGGGGIKQVAGMTGGAQRT